MKKLLLLLSVVCALTASAQQVAKGLTAANGQFIGFWQYTPTDYNANPNTKYPLIISLHGVGEKGNGTTDLYLAGQIGVAQAIKNGHNMTFTWNGKTETFLVLSPQLSKSYGGWQNWYIDEMIAYAKKNLRIDENRIFLTGLSLGGGGTWYYAGSSLANAQKLAGIGVTCGTCQWLTWSNITNANLPVWAFHAQDDSVVGAGCTTSAIKSIEALNPAVKPYMTIWPTGDHWIWGRVYDTEYRWQNPNLYEWFLAQNKSKAPNKRPVANAGNNTTITTAIGTVTLDASKSTDADGKFVRFIWTKIAGPNAGKITAPVSESNKTTVTGLTIAGTYTYELKAVDDRADWSLSTVTVTVTAAPPPVTNKPPVVNAGADITVTQPTSIITLKGTATDADGTIASIAWSKVSGPAKFEIASPNSATTTVSGLDAGTYVFRLTAIDNNNATVSDDITVTVRPNDGSVGDGVNAGPDATITLPTNSVSLDGSASVDPYGGSIYAWKWAKLSGPSQFNITNTGVATTTATNLVEGTYEFQLTTWNSKWVPKSDIKVVVVKKSGTTQPPPAQRVANAGADITITLPANSATLNGAGSSNPNGAITSYAWTKLSGPSGGTIANSTAAVATVSGLTQGTYSFRLTAWDHLYVPSSDTVLIIVKPGNDTGSGTGGGAAGRIPNAGADQTITLPANSATLNATASSNPNGAINAYTWYKIGGPAGGTITSAKSAITTVTGLTAGTYSFRLVVWDHQFVPSADTMKIVVLPALNGGNNGNETPGNEIPDNEHPLPGNGASGNGSITNAGPDQSLTLPTNHTTLNGSASHDPAGVFRAWAWVKISGPDQHNIANASQQNTTVSNLVEGTYRFKLTGWGNDWRPFADTVQITVRANATARTTTNTIVAATTETTAGTEANAKTATTTDVKAAAAIGAEALLVYPNPAQGQINVQTTSTTIGTAFLNIYDMAGKLILKTGFQKQQPLHQQAINIASLTPGVYQAEVVIDNQTRLMSKFIKQ